MLAVLGNQTYRHLYLAQVIALIGTGLMTVALGLLAFKIAGEKAGAVLGTALAIKMIAYVGVAPVVGAFSNLLPRRGFLVAMDLTRASVALALPFVSEVWHVYVLIFVLQSASAAFTPTFQATIPDILVDEEDYTRALSLSRLAYDTESLLSPTLAAALLTVVSYNWLFFGTVTGFLISASLVVSVIIPQAKTSGSKRSFFENLTRGVRIYFATPRLRGLLALNLAVAAAGSMVIVNTIVVVKGLLGGSDQNVAIALACFGGGSMIAALTLPRILDQIPDRNVMLSAGFALALLIASFAAASQLIGLMPSSQLIWPLLLLTWMLLGVGYSAVMTPSGRLLRRSARPEDRPSLFSAQFALSHVCWLMTYPLAGWLGSAAGIPITLLALSLIACGGVLTALKLWPGRDTDTLSHRHTDLPAEHPHIKDGSNHSHAYVIDDLHPRWP